MPPLLYLRPYKDVNMEKSEFWRQWDVDGKPKDKIRIADAAWEAAWEEGSKQEKARADAAEERIKPLLDALEKIAAQEHPNVGEGKCHWEGCNSPLLAQNALADYLHTLFSSS